MPELLETQSYLPMAGKVDMFRYLSEKEMTELLSVSETVSYEPGEAIVCQGDVSDYLFAVIEGETNVSVRELSKEDVVISSIREGEVFGETAIFTREERTATVTAEQKTVVFRTGREQMLAYMLRNPSAGNKLLMVIILGLINKLKSANAELAMEKQPEIDFDYVDDLIQDFMKEI